MRERMRTTRQGSQFSTPKPKGRRPEHQEKRNEDGAVPEVSVTRPERLVRTNAKSIAKRGVSFSIVIFLRKEVIQPQVPLRLPCYDFTPVADPTVVACLLAVGAAPSGRTNSHGVTGGVYKARERIHRGMLIRDY
jgi:hypothetical protein